MKKAKGLQMGVRSKLWGFSFFGILSGLALSACAPKIYLKDRHTVMEDEAAGEWPDFEKELIEKTQAASPAPLQKVELSAKKRRLYNVLNAELVSQERPQ